jgi:trehalose synthase
VSETATVMHVPFATLEPQRLAAVVGPERAGQLLAAADAVRERLDGRRIVNINSTATGGGVAELLQTLLGYSRGAGVATDWLVIRGDPAFFATTKRIHNWLYGHDGDGGALGKAERRAYERTLDANTDGILAAVQPGDVVIVHDPQPAGLVPALVRHGARVVWRCHVGFDGRNEWTARGWRFLRPYVESAHAFVFSRAAFAPSYVPRDRLATIAPSIDPFSPKNIQLSAAEVTSALAAAGLVARPRPVSSAHVVRPAQVLREGPAPGARAPLVVQISRWDRLKDMGGVLQGFVGHVPHETGAHLVLAGPAFSGIADDPEAASVWEETVELWEGLPARERSRVHLALIPMDDPVENASIVNALQRHAAIVVQKSLAEGFGLTVAEAMWKARPVIGSAVGGIVDQLVDGESGVLLADASDLAAFGRAVAALLAEPRERTRLGRNAKRRATERFLPDRHLLDYAAVVANVLD